MPATGAAALPRASAVRPCLSHRRPSMSMKTLVDRRFLVLWLGIGFIGCTLLMSALGCGEMMHKFGMSDSPNHIGSGTDALDTNQVRGPSAPARLEEYFLQAQADLDSVGPYSAAMPAPPGHLT